MNEWTVQVRSDHPSHGSEMYTVVVLREDAVPYCMHLAFWTWRVIRTQMRIPMCVKLRFDYLQ